jgi:hypothetical protein
LAALWLYVEAKSGAGTPLPEERAAAHGWVATNA